MHSLDLPNLRDEPSAETIMEILTKFKPKSCKNFDEHDENDQPVDISGLFNWLTRIVGSELGWLTEDERDDVWGEAGLRMAERCGRTAAPTRVREIDVVGMPEPIELIEPALTEDNLGFKTWGSSLVLANRLVRQPYLLDGRVLELGSGTGLVAIVGGRLGADITATDLPAIVPNLQKNIDQNRLTISVNALELDWNDPGPFLDAHGQFDTIVVADPVYSMDHPALVCKTINVLLKRSGESKVVVQLPQRAKFDDVRELLYDNLKKLGLSNKAFEIEDGQDEFGIQKFAWSLWQF